jgi:hypothetical protein
MFSYQNGPSAYQKARWQVSGISCELRATSKQKPEFLEARGSKLEAHLILYSCEYLSRETGNPKLELRV